MEVRLFCLGVFPNGFGSFLHATFNVGFSWSRRKRWFAYRQMEIGTLADVLPAVFSFHSTTGWSGCCGRKEVVGEI